MDKDIYHEEYIPSPLILDKYADLLVNFSLNKGRGLQDGEVVNLRLWKDAYPMRTHIEKYILQAGGKLIDNLVPINDFDTNLYASIYTQQLQEHYAKISQSIIEQSDHEIVIVSDDYWNALESIDNTLLLLYQDIKKNYNTIKSAKMKTSNLWYALAYYPTKSMADAAGLTMKEYREEIIHACFLDEINPKEKRKEVFTQLHSYRDKLSDMNIKSLYIRSKDVDLKIKIGSDRKWLWWTYRNMPSYEIFVSPDRRGTEWLINFSEPLYEKWKLIDGIKLIFKEGRVVKATAKIWEDFLHMLLQTKNFDKIGEFSFTDNRFSRINKFMANSLYDENRWWAFGNMHIALWDSYKDSYKWDENMLTQKDFEEKWFNSSSLHIDMISTQDRIVTAKLENWEEKIIYKNWQFTLDD